MQQQPQQGRTAGDESPRSLKREREEMGLEGSPRGSSGPDEGCSDSLDERWSRVAAVFPELEDLFFQPDLTAVLRWVWHRFRIQYI